MRRRVLFVLLLLSTGFLAGVPDASAQASRAARLEVFEAQPSPRAPLGVNDSVVFHFNRRVDCQQAAAAFSVTPAVPGELRCDPFTLSFTPATPYPRDTAITFALTPPLTALDGAPLRDPFQATYTTAGYLAVSEAYPSALGGAAPVDSAITVVFDRPVAPLAVASAVDELPVPLSIEPATAGKGAWVNSAVYTFTPARPLASGQAYRVSVAPDLKAVDGAEMRAEYAWTFETAPASIIGVDPPPGATGLSLAPKIQVRFNQAMDRRAIEAAFYLRPLPGDGEHKLAGSFAWADDGMGFAFAPDSRLELDSFYQAGFSTDLLPDLELGSAQAPPALALSDRARAGH